MVKPVYNFKEREKYWLNFWEKENIYHYSSLSPKRVYSIDTPPPTVSGPMHVGHAFSYTNLDVVARFHRMKGENVLFPFGIDDDGLATEKMVEKRNGVKITNMERDDFIKLCQTTIRNFAPSFIQDWKNIGLSADFNLSYSTISSEVQRISQLFFIDLYKKRRVYRKKAPVIWCPNCQTAIAQAELEDREIETTFNYIKFNLKKGGYISIATTRPELLSSCVAVFVSPSDNRYKGLIGQKLIVPIFGYEVQISSDPKVDPQKGTGVVMVCTFGDTTDMAWYLSHNLPLKISISKEGRMTDLAGPYKGMGVKEARKKIISDLKEKGYLIKQENIKHTVNVHERCGTEVEIIPSTQWFIKYLDLKEDFWKMAQKIKWFPDYMKIRLKNWIEGLQWDWCISRQRYFGIPFPVWYSQSTGEVILADVSQLPVDPLHSFPKNYNGPKEDIRPEKDVMDTWVTSALTPVIIFSLLQKNKLELSDIGKIGKFLPLSLRPQAHDIINFWLFYTLARSKLHFNKIPWKNIMISGFVLDSRGKKMSKSKGNIVNPRTVLEKYGADALRYWATGANLGEDIRYNEEEVKKGLRLTNKLWNAFNFCRMHLENYEPEGEISQDDLNKVDVWLISKFQGLLRNYFAFMDSYDYFKARKMVDNFFWDDFCGNYLEIVKYRLYSLSPSDKNYQSAQFTLYYIFLGLIKLYAPYIPFICEEIYQDYFRAREKVKSIHLTRFEELNSNLDNKKVESEFEKVIAIIAFIRKFKSENKYSMKKEISEIDLDSKDKSMEEYFDVIRHTMSVKKIIFSSGGTKISDNLSIKIIL